MSETYVQKLSFTIDGQAEDLFTVFRLTGREAISELFRFEIDVVSDNSELVVETLAGRTATLSITRLRQTRQIHGIIECVEQLDATPHGQFVYRAVLVPRLHKLAMTRQNQIHGTTTPVTVREVIADELTANALHGVQAVAVAGRLDLSDFEFRLIETYPQRDYIVQYDESDFAFVSRLCEHYGIFYFFTHDQGRDVVVFGDCHVAFPQADGPGTLTYRTASGLTSAEEASVFRFVSRTSVVPAQVCLRDYNYRLPSLTLEVDATVDPHGHGVVIDYGSHFRTPDEGRDLARVRAQELSCRKQVFTGASDSVQLTAGRLFDLEGHFRDDFDASYVVTWIEHEATQAVPGIADVAGPDHQTSYRNRFECLRKGVEFRPARKTPKPRMAGLSNATVDAEGAGVRAELDSSGRYKIRQQFDQRGETAGQASRYMRKAEPYGGANTGMHFPLLKGTEVVLACVNGDPDRPIIVGAMQNEQYPSIVNSRNSTINRLRTTGGTLFEIDDGPAAGSGGGSGAGGGGNLAPQRALEGPSPSLEAARRAARRAMPPRRPLTRQRAESDIETTGDSTSSYARLQVTSGTGAYWRLGSAPTDTTEDALTPGMSDMTGGDDAGGGGLFEYTAGDRTSLIEGSRYREVDTDDLDYVKGTRRMSAATHTAVSKGQYQVVGEGISLKATDGTITDDSSASDAASGEMVVTTSGDFTMNIGGHNTAQYAGTSFDWIQGTTTSYRSGSVFSIFLGSQVALSTGNYSQFFLGAFRNQIWLGMNLDIGVGVFDIKLRLAMCLYVYLYPKLTLNGMSEIKAYFSKVEATATAEVASAPTLADICDAELTYNLAACDLTEAQVYLPSAPMLTI